jgi:hypothetical protein
VINLGLSIMYRRGFEVRLIQLSIPALVILAILLLDMPFCENVLISKMEIIALCAIYR